jgi:putative nucleotidyltransferase with HDIG domain
MKPDDLKHFKTWFADYVAKYYTDDPAYNKPIQLKLEHTERVCEEIVMLGQALNLPKEDMLLAETMALFHDVGRFEQYAVYGTFKDAVSEDHAELGLQELTKHKVFEACSDMEKSLITKAIGHHNVRNLPEEEDERGLFFTRLLRDADKLDIWRVFVDYYARQDEEPNSTIVLGLPNNEACSHKILDALLEHRMADLKDMTTLNDFKLLQISWVFDLNYRPTYRTVYERQYVDRISATLPQTTEVAEVVAKVQIYVKEQNSAN